MQEQKLVAGLDIGTQKVTCVIGQLDQYDNLEVLGLGSATNDGVQRGQVTNIDRTVEAIKRAVKMAEDSSRVDIRYVNVGISGPDIRCTEQTGSLTRPAADDTITIEDVHRLTNDMYRTVIPHGNQIIHVLPKEYKVDYANGVADPVGMKGVRLDANFHIVYSHITSVSNVMLAVKKAGLEVDNLYISSLASGLACVTEEDKDMGVAVVDIGAGTTDIAVYHDKVVRYTSVIPYGGSIVTNDIRTGCNLMMNQAEHIKTRFGVALQEEANASEIISIESTRVRTAKELSVRSLAGIIEARMTELVEIIHNEIIASGFEDRLGAGIVITGGGSELKSLPELIEFVTGLECRREYPTHFLGRTDHHAIKSPTYSTAIGLVLAGFRNLDFRQERYSKLPNTASTLAAKAKATPEEKESSNSLKSIFKNLIDRTKGLLVDDVPDSNGYN